MIFELLTHNSNALHTKTSPYNYIYWIFIHRGILINVLYSFVKGQQKKDPYPLRIEYVSLNRVYNSVYYYYFSYNTYNRTILR